MLRTGTQQFLGKMGGLQQSKKFLVGKFMYLRVIFYHKYSLEGELYTGDVANLMCPVV